MSARVGLVTRRQLLLAGGLGGAGLLLGVWAWRRRRKKRVVPDRGAALAPSAFVAVEPDDTVRVWVGKSEMGQGVWTALPMLVAEELDADWDKVLPVQPLADPAYGQMGTAVSSSVRSLWTELRTAGAMARLMLVAAAADLWDCSAAECTTERGHVLHGPSGRSAAYGSLVALAKQQRVPEEPALRAPSTFRLVGTDAPRKDVRDKVTGEARFGLDVRLPGMLRAVVLRCPHFGGRLVRSDTSAARAVPGVVDVLDHPNGIAVVARDTWTALQARMAVIAEWSPGTGAGVTSDSIAAQLRTAVDVPGNLVWSRGRGAVALGTPGKLLSADYSLPYLAHATMEPIHCTAWIHDGMCELWVSTQSPQAMQQAAARALDIAPERVVVHPMFVGGGFGRRVMDEEVLEAVAIAKRFDVPVQLVWSREDDLQHDFYRPAAHHRIEAVLDAGTVRAWRHRIAAPAVVHHDAAPDFVCPVGAEGATDLAYAVPDAAVEYRHVPTVVPTGFWRSVGHSHTAFAVECFLDEAAAALQVSPFALRRSLLQDHPRQRAVLDAVERLAQRHPVAGGVARGLAFHSSFGSHVAMLADVTRDARGRIRVVRVLCAADTGLVVHPDLVRSQLEGAIVFGATAALHGRIDLQDGAVTNSTHLAYPLLRFSEAPQVEVELVRGADEPGGVGEIGVPPVAPAIANALAALDGSRTRDLPLQRAR